MIYDKIENLLNYIPKHKQAVVLKFIEKLSSNMEEGTYNIDGDKIYAKVMSYPTKLQADCTIEAHDKYIDIQFTLIGEEGISVCPRESLECVSRDEEKDFFTFQNSNFDPQVQINNKAGWFTLLKTSEAHRPQESPDGTCSVVKKGVIKIKKELYENENSYCI